VNVLRVRFGHVQGSNKNWTKGVNFC